MEFVSSWQPLAVSAATLSLLIVGTAYCLSFVFDSRTLKAWAKNEAVQAVASALLVGLLVFFATGLDSLSADLTGGDGAIQFAQSYLRGVNANLSSVSDSVLLFNLAVSAIKELDFDLKVLGFGVSLKPLIGLTPVVNDAEFILSALSFVRLTNTLQDVFLTFVSVTMMYYFLPIGVILRTFSLTRRVGAFMIALAIGLYFVFPLTYIFNSAALERQHALIASNTEALRLFSEKINLSALNFLDPSGLAAFVSELITKSFWNAAVDAIRSLNVLVADLTIQTTFFPLFNLGVVYLFSTSLYRALKSEERWFVWN